eukprot:6385889-Pyramimonas_sp.AAC.1
MTAAPPSREPKTASSPIDMSGYVGALSISDSRQARPPRRCSQQDAPDRSGGGRSPRRRSP